MKPDFNQAATAGELNRVRQDIPHDLLQTVCIAGNQSHAWLEKGLYFNALRLGRRTYAFNCRFNDWLQVTRTEVEVQLTSDDSGNLQQVIDQLTLCLRIADDGLKCNWLFLGIYITLD